jgi:hypothetical protein
VYDIKPKPLVSTESGESSSESSDELSNESNEIYVDCFPVLPENILIDDQNNIHVWISKSITEVFEKNRLEFSLGSQLITFPSEKLFIRKKQIQYLYEQGIPRINIDDMYNTSKLGDIIIYLTLE